MSCLLLRVGQQTYCIVISGLKQDTLRHPPYAYVRIAVTAKSGNIHWCAERSQAAASGNLQSKISETTTRTLRRTMWNFVGGWPAFKLLRHVATHSTSQISIVHRTLHLEADTRGAVHTSADFRSFQISGTFREVQMSQEFGLCPLGKCKFSKGNKSLNML